MYCFKAHDGRTEESQMRPDSVDIANELIYTVI